MDTTTLSGLRVLCVEDDPDIRAIAELALRDVGGFEVELCPGGAEALAMVDDLRPDLVLLDVMMPGMNGPETFQALKQHPCMDGIPVIFMTARLQPDEIEEYLALGVIGVIPKPFDPMTLAGQIRDILAGQPGG